MHVLLVRLFSCGGRQVVYVDRRHKYTVFTSTVAAAITGAWQVLGVRTLILISVFHLHYMRVYTSISFRLHLILFHGDWC